MIVKIGDPVLRKIAKNLDPHAPETQDIINDMRTALYETDGALAVAAPQVGHSVRAFIYRVDGVEGVCLNPELSIPDDAGVVSIYENCLSIPGYGVMITRPDVITIAHSDEYGQNQNEEIQGFLARVIQHEMDHLDGKLIYDYMNRAQRRDAKRFLARQGIKGDFNA